MNEFGKQKPDQISPTRQRQTRRERTVGQQPEKIFVKEQPRSFAETVQAHDKKVLTVWRKAFGNKLEYYESPETEEQILENQIHAIISIGTRLNIKANGLSGYNSPQQTMIQNSRENMVNVICEGKVRPAGQYYTDFNPSRNSGKITRKKCFGRDNA